MQDSFLSDVKKSAKKKSAKMIVVITWYVWPLKLSFENVSEQKLICKLSFV